MAVKYILFDLDGTLLDTNELIVQSFRHTYKEHLNKDVPREYIIQSFGEILRTTLERECKDCVEAALTTYRSFQQEHFESYITLHLGVREALEKLTAKGYKLGIVTSRLNESALRGLKFFDIEGYFHSIIGADDTDLHKPDPTPARMALEAMGGRAEEAVLVGDSPFDIQCAKNTGMVSVAVGWSALPREVYMQYEPDYVVDTMEELVELIYSL
ncbi:pyrophosphatase PpaX [Geosporobacter subterraneus DSM 17957]|uniref:Pyrophosphatase PpaX n=1 Tax=Geosporobacter subterraneus DSM 17957 TaxID=1121919 RepID=A0A1M6CRA0_9FIRM|nr:HAD-IA family hydrolase [Geosporobacter subterraneus]SHI63324.1 pyrophosphatase PpaX [Geosporobacter subterraneus DSM 17957]